MRGHFAEGRRWHDLALARTTDPAARVKLLLGAGQLAFFQDQASQARRLWTEMAELGRAMHDEAVESRALARLAYLLRVVGEHDEAVTVAEESLRISRRLGDRLSIAHALHGYANVMLGIGDLDRAEPAWTEAVMLYRQVGEVVSVPYMLGNLGHIARRRGELGKALALFQEQYELVRHRGDTFGIRGAVLGMLRVGYHQGDDRRVLAMAREALILGREQGSAGVIALALEGLAWVAAVRDDAPRAARLLGAAEAVRATSGPGMNVPQPELVEDTLAAIHEALGEDACAAARAEGRAMRLDAALALSGTELAEAAPSRPEAAPPGD
jgi:tetratricopeptide (TPR) repeat protein